MSSWSSPRDSRRPTDRSNLIVRAFERLHSADGIAFRVRSEIPLARGLGSSASAIVAGLLAADHLFELAVDREAILAHATELEGHPDNVAAALYGGITLCPPGPEGGPQLPRLPFCSRRPRAWRGSSSSRSEEVSTSAARAAMPAELPLADVTHNVAAAAQLALGIERSDLDLIRSGLADRVHQPRRAHLYPAIDGADRARRRSSGRSERRSPGPGPTVLVWAFWQSGPGLLERARGVRRGLGRRPAGPSSPRAAPGSKSNLGRSGARAFWSSSASCSSSSGSRAANSGGGS